MSEIPRALARHQLLTWVMRRPSPMSLVEAPLRVPTLTFTSFESPRTSSEPCWEAANGGLHGQQRCRAHAQRAAAVAMLA